MPTMAEPLSLYLHIPFCTAKCGYCDFNSYAGQDHLIPNYSDALVQEARLWRNATQGRSAATVFFGGGTPSLMPIDEFASVMDGIRAAFDVAADAEVSLEANPGSLDEAYLRGLLDLGVNRLSIGVQSFHDDELKDLDRIHSAADAGAAFEAARAAGFRNLSLDLIFGLSDQPLERWQQSVEEALLLDPEHISLYALTVEEGTPLARSVARGRTPAPVPDAQADQYEWTVQRLRSTAFEQYEISNWAKPDFRCRHNLTYWQCRDYLGLGAGAHSYLDGVRFATAALPDRYVALVNESSAAAKATVGAAGDTPMRQVVTGETMTPELEVSDTLILGLRLTDGVSLSGFEERFGVGVMDAAGDAIRTSIDDGLAEIADGHVRLTERGRLLGNEVFERLLPES